MLKLNCCILAAALQAIRDSLPQSTFEELEWAREYLWKELKIDGGLGDDLLCAIERQMEELRPYEDDGTLYGIVNGRVAVVGKK